LFHKKRVTVNLDLDTHRRLKHVSFDTNTTMNDLIVTAVISYLTALNSVHSEHIDV